MKKNRRVFEKAHMHFHCQWRVNKSADLLSLSLTLILTGILRLPFIQPQNVSQEWKYQLWACSVNPPWQDCWDSSASTATLRELPASPSTRQQSSHSGPRPIRTLQRWQARARSSFALCRYGCCVFLFSWEKNLEIEGEESDREMEREGEREKKTLSLIQRSPLKLAWGKYSL